MTDKQLLYRSFLRERNRAKRYRKKYNMDDKRKKKTLKLSTKTHRTNPAFLNDNSFPYTLCGLTWKSEIDSVMLSRYEVTCLKCLKCIEAGGLHKSSGGQEWKLFENKGKEYKLFE